MSDQEPNWSNAWNTAAEHQIPAESTATLRPSHEYTNTTYGSDMADSSDLSDSSTSAWD